jgi:drug/metabolite transporter (DMT)-like permease
MESKNWKGHLAMLLANVIFGLNIPIAGMLMPEVIHPFGLTFFRLVGGLVLFWLASLFLKPEKVTRKDLTLLFFASLFAIILNQYPFFYGLSLTSPIDSSIVVTTLPIVTMLLAALILKEPITQLKAIGVLVGASGALILVMQGTWDFSGQGNMIGNLIISIGVISFALYLTLFKSLVSRYHPITIMKWMFLFATITGLPLSLPYIRETDFAVFTTASWVSIGYVVVMATFFGYLLIPVGQKLLRPTTLSMYNYIQPIMATLVAVYIGSDNFGFLQGLAALLVFSGVYIVTQSKSRAQLEAERAAKMGNRPVDRQFGQD